MDTVEAVIVNSQNDEDDRDIADAKRARVEAERKGIVLWDDLKTETSALSV